MSSEEIPFTDERDIKPQELPISANEVVSWFQESGIKKRPIPTLKHVKPIVYEIRTFTVSRGVTRIKRIEVNRNLDLDARNAANKLAKILKELLDSSEISKMTHTKLFAEEAVLLQHVQHYLKLRPAPRSGRRKRGVWGFVIERWAPMVANVLIEAGWNKPSLDRDGGAVPFVLSRMYHAVFGERIDAKTIGRYLRDVE